MPSKLFPVPLGVACLAAPLIAQADNRFGKDLGRMGVNGATLTYDTSQSIKSLPPEIHEDDLARMRQLLRRNPEVEKVVLNSEGGLIWVSEEMARLIIDYGLDTHVDGECSSACVTVFLAGEARTMSRGSKIGFHQNYWPVEDLRDTYKEWFGDEKGWANPFEMTSWMYTFTQTEAHDHLIYMLDRGVDAEFAIRSEKPVSEYWYPSRVELQNAGVLRD